VSPTSSSIIKNKLKEIIIKIKMIKDMTYRTIANFKTHFYLICPNIWLLFIIIITFFSTNLNEVLIYHNFSGALIM
jgi:hypothetical protein